MSYAVASALQGAIFDALRGSTALSALVGDAVHDAVPPGVVPETYVSLGRERVRDASDQSGHGALHEVDISVFTTLPGFVQAKSIGAVISDILHEADLPLTRGHLIFLRFQRAEALRVNAGTGREIRMRFIARVEDS